VQAISWPWIFWINVPIGLITIALTRVPVVGGLEYLDRRQRPAPDTLGLGRLVVVETRLPAAAGSELSAVRGGKVVHGWCSPAERSMGQAGMRPRRAWTLHASLRSAGPRRPGPAAGCHTRPGRGNWFSFRMAAWILRPPQEPRTTGPNGRTACPATPRLVPPTPHGPSARSCIIIPLGSNNAAGRPTPVRIRCR
jgi:hypothetical protein